MSEYLVIRLSTEGQPVQWLRADQNGTRLSGVSAGSLQDAALAAGNRPVIVMVPAVDVLLTSVHMPVRSVSRIRTALPFALEENLAEDVANLHFALGERLEDNRVSVAIVADEKLRAWQEQLQDAGLVASRMVAEHHGLAKIPGTSSLLIDDATIMFNDGADNEFAMQGVQPSDVLVVAGQLGEKHDEDGESGGHVLVFCDAVTEQQYAHEWIALRHEMNSVDVNVLPDGAFAKLAVTVAAGKGINLLQGKYGRKTEYATIFKPWKAAAMLLLALTCVMAIGKGLDYRQLAGEKAALESQFLAEYRQMRPADTRDIVDPKSLVESLKRSVGASSSPQVFLPSLRELGAALAANNEAKLEAISYRAGVVDLRLTAPDVPTLDRIQKAVSTSGRFTATIQSTDQVADKINGRIQIRETAR